MRASLFREIGSRLNRRVASKIVKNAHSVGCGRTRRKPHEKRLLLPAINLFVAIFAAPLLPVVAVSGPTSSAGLAYRSYCHFIGVKKNHRRPSRERNSEITAAMFHTQQAYNTISLTTLANTVRQHESRDSVKHY